MDLSDQSSFSYLIFSDERNLKESKAMTLTERWGYILAVICYAPLPVITAAPQAPAQQPQPPVQTRTVLSQPLPSLRGDHLSVQVVRVRYAPGQSSQPHSHPCPVIVYVLEGAVRMQVQDSASSRPGPVTTYRAGESFYEAPNGRHLVSVNASQSQPATFTATFVCDHATQLSLPLHAKEDRP
jgi:quercetin dioxygenase-like cupin family protein